MATQSADAQPGARGQLATGPSLPRRTPDHGAGSLSIRIAVLVAIALAILLPAGLWLERVLTDRLTASRLADLRASLENGIDAVDARVGLAETRVNRLAHALGAEANRANAADAAEFQRTTRRGADGTIRVAPPVDPSSEAVFWIPPGHPLDPFWAGLLARGRMVVSQFGLGTGGESSEDVWFLTTSGGEVVYMPTDPAYADRPATAGYDASAWIDPVRPENDADGRLRWLPAQRSPRPPLWYATVVAPVSGRGRFLGAVGIDISIGQVADQSSRLPTGPGHAHLIVEPGGLITYGEGGEFERALTDSITVGGLPSPLRDSLTALLGRVREGRPGVVSSGSVGATMMLAARLGRVDWTVVTLIEKSTVAAPLTSPLRLMRLALAAVLLLLLAAVVAVVAADARRRRGIDALRTRASERFNQLFQLMPVSVALARGSTGEFIEVNDAACRISGVPRERFIGATMANLGLWSDAEEGARVRETIRREGSVSDHATRFRTAAGKGIDVLLAARVIEIDGEPHTLFVVQDLSAQRLLEAQLLHAQKLEAVGRLAGGVAHDFNNLLTAVIGYAQLLFESLPESDERREDAHEILTAARRGAALTRQLLGFARQQSVAPRIVDVNLVVLGIEAMLRSLIGEDVRIVTELDPAIGTVKIDPGQLEQVITNLAVNARDAMPDGGQLTFRTRDDGQQIIIEVSDTGGGIPDDVRAHIFEPFYTTKELGKGTGLGLATCYGIVSQAGGTIDCASTSSHGTTFAVRLPRQGEAADRPAAESRPTSEPAAGRTGCIMVVEDDDMVRAVTTSILEDSGYRVVAKEGPSSALAYLLESSDPVDLVVSDMVMPRMSGPAFGRVLATTHPKMPILFMSAHTPDQAIRGDLSALGHPFLAKPFTREDLLRAVADGLENCGEREAASAQA